MRTLVLLIEYDGTDLSGWQIQPNARTVQEDIEKALLKLTGKRYGLSGSGRTDAGVHAAGQCAHAGIDYDFTIPENKVALALNSNLKKDIRIKNAKIINRQFHARFDAVAREYSYSIATRESVFTRFFSTYYRYIFDPDLLNQAAGIFTGEHDFTTFSKLNESTKSYVCNVEKCKWSRVDEYTYRLKIKADRFVYGMVRALTGVMLEAASGKISINEIEKALKEKDRKYSVALAPPQGLILEKVYYTRENDFFSDQ